MVRHVASCSSNIANCSIKAHKCGKFIEISNSLFIESRNIEGEIVPAETVFSECVIGAERLEMVIQNSPNVQRIKSLNHWRERIHRLLVEEGNENTESTEISVM